jgi:hypothetical protein
MALLEMVNSVLGKLRNERITTISATDELTTEVIGLLNDAGSEILEGHDWSFDVRHDGMMFFPQSQSGTNGQFGGATKWVSPTTATLTYSGDDDAGEIFENAAAIALAAFRMAGDRFRTRIIPTGSSDGGNTSWIVTDIAYGATEITLTLQNNLYLTTDIATGTNAWTTFANEHVLPSTVKQVLSARHEEQPLTIEFVDKDLEYDQMLPRPFDYFTSTPEIMYVGMTVTSTEMDASFPDNDTVAAVTGMGAAVWPIPNADVRLNYSYRVQHADLAADTDAWDGVPNNIIRLIEWKAYQFACQTGIEDDQKRAILAEREVERRLARALGNDGAQPNRRRVPTTFGAYRVSNPRRRWASQTITA